MATINGLGGFYTKKIGYTRKSYNSQLLYLRIVHTNAEPYQERSPDRGHRDPEQTQGDDTVSRCCHHYLY